MADKFEDVFEPIPSAPPAEDFEPVEESTTIPMARGYAPIFAPTFSPPQGNIRPSHIKEAAFTPTVDIPTVTATDLSANPGKAEKIIAGTNRGAAAIAESLTSPVGAATLGIGLLPRLAGRLISGAFAADMARHVPESARQFGQAVGEGDLERSVETGIGTTANVGFAGLAGGHAIPGNSLANRFLPAAAAERVTRPVGGKKPEAPAELPREDFEPLTEKPVLEQPVVEELISPELERALVEAERAPEVLVVEPKVETPVVETIAPKTETPLPEVETIAPKAEPVAAEAAPVPEPVKPKETFKEHIARITKERQDYVDSVKGKWTGAFKTEWKPGRTIIGSKSAIPEAGEYRLSFFDEHGPSSHQTFKTFDEMAAYLKGFQKDPSKIIPAEKKTAKPAEPDPVPEGVTEIVPEHQLQGNTPRQVPVKDLTLSDDVPQFKKVTRPLGGEFDPTGVGPIQLWRRKDGRLEVISGRHRFELAKKNGVKDILAQIHDEAQGFDKHQAAKLDAELNIRDEYGDVTDYANYFKHSKVTEAEAVARGLLAREKGRAGFRIAAGASDDLFALHQSERINNAQAEAIAHAAPGNAGLQAVGIKAALDGKSAEMAADLIALARRKVESRGQGGKQEDLFGFDDTAIMEMEAQAKLAQRERIEIRKEIQAIKGASKNPTLAAKHGVDVSNPEGVVAKVAELEARLEDLRNHPELAGKSAEVPALELAKPESVAEQKARMSEEAARAQKRAQDEKLVELQDKPLVGSTGDIGQADMFGGGDLFSSPAPKAKSKLEAWADETIQDARGRASAGLDPVLLTAHAVKGGFLIERGVTEAGAWATEMVKEYGEEIRPYLPEIRKQAEAMLAAGTLNQSTAAQRTGPGDSPAMGERQFPKKVDLSDQISQEAKLRQGPRLYERRSNETDAVAAARAIDEGGVESSIRDFTDMDVEMPSALRTALGFELQKRLAREEQLAALDGNPEASKAAVDRHIGLLEAITERSTELAQGLQAYSAFTRATPAVLYGWARRQVNKAGGRAIEGLRGGLDKIKETVREVNEKVAEDVAKATEKGLWTLEKEASVEKLVAAAKSRLGGGREKGPVEEFAARLTTQLRAELLKRLPKRAAAVEKLTDAQILREAATNPEKYAEVWKEAQAALRKEFEGNDAALEVIDRAVGNITPELFSTKAIEGLVREEMGAQGLEFRKLIREHYTKQDAAGKSLAQKIVERVGVDEANAAKLAAAVEKRFAEMATERKRAALKALSLPGRLKVKAKALHDKVIELSNLGALDSEAFDAVVKEKLGVSKWDREFAEKVKAAAEAVQAAPEGAQRNSKAIDLMSLVEKQKGTKWYEIPLAIWMTNILTGVGTHAVNLASTGLNTMAETAFQIARKPTHTMSILEAAADGFRKGILEAKDAVRTGKVTGSRLQKVEAMRPLENTTFKGPLKFLNAWKYNFRLMTAADLMIFKSAEEVRSYTAAVELARKEGVRGAELERRVRETLGDTRERLAEAEAIADAEGLKGTDRQRRIDEVIEQGRPEELRQDARDFALRATFNEKPWGLLGSLAEGVNHVTRNRPEAKLVVPFTNIVANVVNRSLDYFPPVGGARYGWAKWSGMIEGKPATEAMIKETLARATAGTALMTGATLAVMKFINDEDPLFMVTGNGPRTPDQKKQLMETGWIPNSIKIGKNYYSYGWTPAAAPMAWLGNLADGYRYKKLEKTDLANRAAYAAALMPKVIMDQSFMSSLADIMTMLERDSTKRAGDIAAKRLFNTATSFAVPNLVRQVDRIFDPTIYEARDIEANMVASIPFARRLNRPALNVLGEPAERYVSERFLKLGKSDPVWRVMADKQAWVSVPDRETMINKRPMTDDEYYQFVETSGKAIRKELERELKAIQAATPDDAKKIVQDIVRDARADAKFTLERKR